MKQIVEQLKNLAKLGVIGIKQSTEDEGALHTDILTMRRITETCGLKLSVLNPLPLILYLFHQR